MAASTLTPSARRGRAEHSSSVAGSSVPASSFPARAEPPARAAPSEQPQRSGAPAPGAGGRELHVVRSSPKRGGRHQGRSVFIAPVLVLLSLLAVAGAQAVLTEGQVKLSNLQAAVSAAQTNRFDLELQVANQEQPSAVISAARRDGMISPAGVTNIPAVDPYPASSGQTDNGVSVDSGRPGTTGRTKSEHGQSGTVSTSGNP
jgi:hypothetical protein